MVTESMTMVDADSYATDEQRWEAVLRRDRAADGAFIVAVRTTGVYCRPWCPSRTPHRANIRFYPDCAAAEAAGFRACKRCRPNQPSPWEQQAAAIVSACRTIEAAEEVPSLDELARAAGMSRFHFQRAFKQTTGTTPRAYAAGRRARRAREELERPGKIVDAIYAAGFNSGSRFYAQSSERLGMTPTAFQRGGAGETIRFAAGRCSLGALLVAATERGICAIWLGDDAEALVHQLEERFHDAKLIGGDAEFERLVATVAGFVDAPARGLDLPLDVRGTAFEQRVWQALRTIPAGATAGYGEVAERIGRAGAARAVAQACAANPLAVAIPCHRVVRTNGALGGYRWGIDRKRELLAREAADAVPTRAEPAKSSL
jgi:AraC family transcriptional regulator of adaptative response/methylated-DNA-[protein]-cysteine methyltransferase